MLVVCEYIPPVLGIVRVKEITKHTAQTILKQEKDGLVNCFESLEVAQIFMKIFDVQLPMPPQKYMTALEDNKKVLVFKVENMEELRRFHINEEYFVVPPFRLFLIENLPPSYALGKMINTLEREISAITSRLSDFSQRDQEKIGEYLIKLNYIVLKGSQKVAKYYRYQLKNRGRRVGYERSDAQRSNA